MVNKKINCLLNIVNICVYTYTLTHINNIYICILATVDALVFKITFYIQRIKTIL